ncbi:MAG: efflux RND transporter periplasmic adaptor subunit [Bacteroidales bacterium]
MKTLLKKLTYLVVIVTILTSCSSSDGSTSDTDMESKVSFSAVQVMTMQYSNISRNAIYAAQLQPYREVHLSSAAPGRIDKIHVIPGQKVAQSQLLVEMDKTQLQQADVQLRNLETDYKRIEALRQVGSASPQQHDQLRMQYDLAVSNVKFLKENARLASPFNGIVSGKYFEDGEMFSGAPNTPDGKAAIISLIQTHQLKAIINVAERFYPLIRKGMEIQLSTDVYQGESFKARIETIYPEINPSTRSFKVEILVPNSDERLRPGMFARAVLEFGQEKAFVLPAYALLKMQGTNERYVYLEKQGKAHRVSVNPGDRYDDRIEIISDQIKPGDKLIIAGHSGLSHGTPVRINQ